MENISLYRTNALAQMSGFTADILVKSEGFVEADRWHSPVKAHTVHQYQDQDGWIWLVTVDDATEIVKSSYCYEPGEKD